MLRTKFIMVGALCISAFVHSAVNDDAEAQMTVGSLETQMLQLENCFRSEKLLTFGPARSYSTFAVSKRFQKVVSSGRINFKISDDTKCDTIMGCIGIVEGTNIESTNKMAELIRSSATKDTSWITAQSMDSHEVARWKRTRKQAYFDDARYLILNDSFDQYLNVRDIGFTLVWFLCENTLVIPMELSTKHGSCSLREVIAPTSLKKDLAILEQCRPSADPIGQLADCAKLFSISHEATVLRLNTERLSAFLIQEFYKKENK